MASPQTRPPLWDSLRAVGDAVADVLLPPVCQVCGQGASSLGARVLCTACSSGWQLLVAACQCCGAPESEMPPLQRPQAEPSHAADPPGGGPCVDERQSSARRCTRCAAKAPPFTVARSAFVYADTLEKAIHAVKYQKAEAVGRFLGQRLAERLELLPLEVAYGRVIPVPLHWRRRFWRGYNQAELLAAPVGAALKVPLELRLGREASFSNQARLGRQERAEAIAGAFSIPAPVAQSLQGLTCLVVDDVFTTGATVGAFVEALLQAGVTRVDVLTLARAV